MSVIVPAYNGDRFLAEAIDSVLNQTYQSVEVIIVDDGSTDHTRHVLLPYLKRQDISVKYIYQENQGVAAARNQGLKFARGKYIAFLDQDDVYFPTKLEEQIQIFEQYPSLGIVHSGWQRVQADGSPIIEVRPWEKVPLLDAHGWLLWMPVFFSAMLFRKTWLDKVGPLNTQFIQACDVDLIQRLVSKGCTTEWLRKVTVCYRLHDRNESSKTKLQAQESWAVRNNFFSQANLPRGIQQREAEYRYHTLVWIAWRLCITDYFTDALQYLALSLYYSPYTPSQTIINWIKGMDALSKEQGYPSISLNLINIPEWKQLLQTAIGYHDP